MRRLQTGVQEKVQAGAIYEEVQSGIEKRDEVIPFYFFVCQQVYFN
jgi:hypothetical protein